MTSAARPLLSSRLRADVDLYPVADGHLLRVGADLHHVHLAAADLDALLDALLADPDTRGATPATVPARDALTSLVDAGLVDPAPARLAVVGDGLLARALAAALRRMGADVTPAEDGVREVQAVDDPERLPPEATTACWLDGSVALLTPPAVAPGDVVARRRAATRHRDTDPRTAPVAGRAVAAVPGDAGVELAATTFAAALLRPGRAAYEAVVVDLRTLTVGHHPVLPVPPAPR